MKDQWIIGDSQHHYSDSSALHCSVLNEHKEKHPILSEHWKIASGKFLSLDFFNREFTRIVANEVLGARTVQIPEEVRG
jgi:hypothetical protein